eukprot:6948592-Pyramimonas_sp.AAC.1
MQLNSSRNNTPSNLFCTTLDRQGQVVDISIDRHMGNPSMGFLKSITYIAFNPRERLRTVS